MNGPKGQIVKTYRKVRGVLRGDGEAERPSLGVGVILKSGNRDTVDVDGDRFPVRPDTYPVDLVRASENCGMGRPWDEAPDSAAGDGHQPKLTVARQIEEIAFARIWGPKDDPIAVFTGTF